MDLKEHLLTCLAEEAGEIVQAVGKANRFGLKDGYPGTGRTNEKDLYKEINHLMAVAELLNDCGVMEFSASPSIIADKQARVMEYIDYSKERGTLK